MKSICGQRCPDTHYAAFDRTKRLSSTRRLCKQATLSIGAPVGEPEGGSFTGTFKRQMKAGSGNGASLIILCGTEEETSVHVLCECKALASLRYAYMGSFFLDPEDIMNLNIGAIWNISKGIWLL